MLKVLRSAVIAAGLFVAPFAVSAATLSPGDTAILEKDGAWDWSKNFNVGAPGSTFTWTFNNIYNNARTLDLAGSLNELQAKFGSGASFTITSGTETTTILDSRSDGISSDSDSFNTSILFDAREIKTLKLTFGTITGSTINKVAQANFTASVAPIPVPAAGVMLLSGLAGLVGLRRRRKVA